MQIRDYLRVLRRRWLLILGSVIGTVALAALVTSQLTPQYSSTARVFISTIPSSSDDAYQGGLFSEQRVGSYADLAGGLGVSRRVVDELGLDISAKALSDKITASVVPETVVLKIDVTDTDPKEAQRINEGVVRVLQSLVRELETPAGRKAPLLKATVVEEPGLPDSPTWPLPIYNLGLGLLLGVLLGIGLAVLREILDVTVKRVEDVAALGTTPVLSALAYDSEVRKQPLISSISPSAPRAEAYRVLRTNLSFLDVDQPSKAVVVTSSVESEGKSTTAVNAAIATAQAGERVLLIDGDLRRPEVAGLLGLERSVGLTTVLVGKSTLHDAVQKHAASGLDVLTSGQLPPNPAEMLQSKTMQDLLAAARAEYDVIIIDAPPLLPVTDAAVLAAETDGAVLIVKHGETTKDQVSGAVDRLASVGSRPLGVIFNMVPASRSGRYGNNYGYAPDAKSLSRDGLKTTASR